MNCVHRILFKICEMIWIKRIYRRLITSGVTVVMVVLLVWSYLLPAEYNNNFNKYNILNFQQNISDVENEYVGFGDIGLGNSDLHSKLADSNEIKFNLWEGRWDQRKYFRIHDYVIVADKHTFRAKVCLATQASVNKLTWLSKVLKHWSGPLSLAVYVPGTDWAIAIAMLKFLKHCNVGFRERVDVHMLYPKVHPPVMTLINYSLINCNDEDAYFKNLLTSRKKEYKEHYPQNHLRNIARRSCISEKVLVTDIDIIPSFGMFEKLKTFFKDGGDELKCKTCVNVIPTFELNLDQDFPRNKSEIVHLVKLGQAHFFHRNVYQLGHRVTNYQRWNSNTEEGPVLVSYKIPKIRFGYEPFYVSSGSVPDYDERFVGYGCTRNVQTFEMAQMGYKFQVLSPIFTIHWGFQYLKDQESYRVRENKRNTRLAYKIVTKEIINKATLYKSLTKKKK